MTLFYITDYPNEPDDSLKGCYSSKLYHLFATEERMRQFAELGLEGVIVPEVVNVSELKPSDFMFCYQELQKVVTDNFQSDWLEIEKLFQSDPRYKQP